jgi:hypothetical protein
MNFAQWLFLQENFESNRFQSREERVKSGKEQEARILQAMIREHGWNINSASASQDKFDKIDGFLLSAPEPPPISLPAPIQIKYRDTGDDLLMEVVWEFRNQQVNLDQLLTGRDMKGLAKIYLCLNKIGTLARVRLADEAKSFAKKLLEGLLLSGKKIYSIGKSQIRITEDPENRRPKINAYIDPNDSFFSWKKDYPIMDLWSEPVPMKQDPSQVLPKDVPSSILPAIKQALESGAATFPIPNNAKKVKAIEKYVGKRGIIINIESDKIILKKIA